MQQAVTSSIPAAAGMQCAQLPTVDDSAGGVCRTLLMAPVSDDAARERAIVFAGQQLIAWMGEWERSGDFAHRGAADFWRIRQEALIHGRSAGQVAAMERARGLA